MSWEEADADAWKHDTPLEDPEDRAMRECCEALRKGVAALEAFAVSLRDMTEHVRTIRADASAQLHALLPPREPGP